jgi:hypothetical protein
LPLVISAQVVDPDDGGPQTPTPRPEIGIYDPVWIAPDGTELPLNPPGSDFFSLRAVGGLGAVAVDIVTTEAAEGGTVVDGVRTKSRAIAWPLRIRGATHLEFLTRWRTVVDLFVQTRRLGPGRLRITRPDGTRREILAYYQAGLEGDPDDGLWTRASPVVGLYCPDGLWRDVDPTVREWRQEAGQDYLNPFPSFSAGQVIGAASLRNDGRADAWPTWTIRGPMTSLIAANLRRAETFTLTYALGAGQTMTMTTQPVQVRGPGGVQAVSALNLLDGGIPWRVDARAVTDIQFTASGTAPDSSPGANDGTLIRAEFVQKHETS